MVSSSHRLIFKLFLPEGLAEGCNFDSDHCWRDVEYSFFPTEGRPTDIKLVFKNHYNMTVTAKLPERLADVQRLVDAKTPFILSNPRVNLINDESLGRFKVSKQSIIHLNQMPVVLSYLCQSSFRLSFSCNCTPLTLTPK